MLFRCAPRSCLCACDLESWFLSCMRVEKPWSSVPRACFIFFPKCALTSQISLARSQDTEPPSALFPQSQPSGADRVMARVAHRDTEGEDTFLQFSPKHSPRPTTVCRASDTY